ncbi:MAG: hypothetical protein CM15mV2_1140 [uncultured marine virus]|nr:MAG: hypothetical protein CM15mV2_1140 [uncultured marine virus]
MLAVTLTFGTILLIGTAIISGMIGWVLENTCFTIMIDTIKR